MYDLQPGSSPLSFVGGGLAAPQQQQQQQFQPQKAPTIEPTQPAETNAERNYRDAANLSEVAAPIAFGSAVIFAFHSMQVAGGSIIPIGIYGIYLGAKLGNSHRRWTTAIVGAGISGGMIAATSEPAGEFQQAAEGKGRIISGIQEIKIAGKKPTGIQIEYLPSIALAAIILVLALKGRK